MRAFQNELLKTILLINDIKRKRETRYDFHASHGLNLTDSNLKLYIAERLYKDAFMTLFKFLIFDQFNLIRIITSSFSEEKKMFIIVSNYGLLHFKWKCELLFKRKKIKENFFWRKLFKILLLWLFKNFDKIISLDFWKLDSKFLKSSFLNENKTNSKSLNE